MLELDADRRITAEQSLAHPYLAQYADPTDEPASTPYDQTFEDFDLTVDQWKGEGERKIANRPVINTRVSFQNMFGTRSKTFGLLSHFMEPTLRPEGEKR